MKIRAKFVVDSVTVEPANPDHTTVRLHPVYSSDPSHENAKYWKYTPSGQIMMTVLSRVLEGWEADQEYYIDFTRADEA